LDQFELIVAESGDIAKPLEPYTFKDEQPYVRRYSLFGDILKLGNKLDKANNHQYFKADVHVKLVLNANAFIAGRFYLTYSPYENRIEKARKQVFNSRAGITAYPGVEIDLQIDNTVEMVIPFASYKEAYDLQSYTDEDFVTLYLFALTPLMGGASNTIKVDISIYAWFENITIIMPTVKNIPALEAVQNDRIEKIVAKKVAAMEPQNKPNIYAQRMEKIRTTQPTIYKYILTTLGIKEREAQMQCDEEFKDIIEYPLIKEDEVENPARLQLEVDYLNTHTSIMHNYVDMMKEGLKARDYRDCKYAFDLLEEFCSVTDNRLITAVEFIRKYFIRLQEEIVIKTVKEVVARMEIQSEAAKGPQEYGIISDVAATVGGVADAVSGIPVVGEVAGTVKWISDIVGNIASIFGWSRPNDMERVVNYVGMPGKFYSHVTAVDNSVALALSQHNELGDLRSIFPSKIDEMELNYVCANPAIKEVIYWNKNHDINRTLALLECGVGPFNRYASKGISCNSATLYYDTEVASPPFKNCINTPEEAKQYEVPENKTSIRFKGEIVPTIMDTTPCEYVSQLFQFWRGTICFKISVVKTAFHTGRLEIFFDPGRYYVKDNPSDARQRWHNRVDLTAYDDADTTNNYKYILDLTQDTEITIRVPFVSDKLMLSTLSANSYSLDGVAGQPDMESIFNSLFGSLVIRPVSKLLAPDTVSEQVAIVVWKWAENMEFAVPKESNQLNIVPYEFDATVPKCETPNLTQNDIINFIGKWPMNAIGTCSPREFVRGPIPKCKTRAKREVKEVKEVEAEVQINLANKAAGNEIDIFQGANSGVGGITVLADVAGEKLVSLRPLLRAFRPIAKLRLNEVGFGIANDAHTKTKDYFSVLSYLYRFYRGGVRYKFFSDKVDVDAKITSTLVLDLDKAHPTTCGPTHTTYNKLNPVHEVMIPYYSQFRKLPVTGGINTHKLYAHANADVDCELFRSGNDDFTYGWLMGSPQIYLGATQQWNCWEEVKNTVDP
jgi:hypothetical protein